MARGTRDGSAVLRAPPVSAHEVLFIAGSSQVEPFQEATSSQRCRHDIVLTQPASDSTNASANVSTAIAAKRTGKLNARGATPNIRGTFSKTWAGGVLAPATGMIYGIPADANAVLVIDPAKGTIDTTSMQVRIHVCAPL